MKSKILFLNEKHIKIHFFGRNETAGRTDGRTHARTHARADTRDRKSLRSASIFDRFKNGAHCALNRFFVTLKIHRSGGGRAKK